MADYFQIGQLVFALNEHKTMIFLSFTDDFRKDIIYLQEIGTNYNFLIDSFPYPICIGYVAAEIYAQHYRNSLFTLTLNSSGLNGFKIKSSAPSSKRRTLLKLLSTLDNISTGM